MNVRPLRPELGQRTSTDVVLDALNAAARFTPESTRLAAAGEVKRAASIFEALLRRRLAAQYPRHAIVVHWNEQKGETPSLEVNGARAADEAAWLEEHAKHLPASDATVE